MSAWTGPPVHPAADKFPMMGDAELEGLAADILANGQRVPIQMLNGAILDGRNRWRACEIAKVAPIVQDWKGQGSPAGYVLSINLRRRHLTPEQQAAVAVEFEELFKEEAEQRMKAGKGNPGAETTPGSGKRDDSGRALAQAAEAVGASLDSAKKLKAAAKVDAELLALAKDGKVNVSEARRLAAMPAKEREKAKEKIKGGSKARDVVPAPQKAPRPPVRVVPDADPGPGDDVPEVQLRPGQVRGEDVGTLLGFSDEEDGESENSDSLFDRTTNAVLDGLIASCAPERLRRLGQLMRDAAKRCGA